MALNKFEIKLPNIIVTLTYANVEIHNIPSRLRDIADAFSIIGNDKLSDELNRIDNRVAFCNGYITEATNQALNYTTQRD